MAAAETARLLAELNLGGNFNKEADKAIGKVGKLEGTFDRIGGHAKRGLGTAARNLAGLGVVAGGVIGLAVKTGLDDLATLEDATSSVDGAIKQVGLTGKITAAQVVDAAGEIESAIGAAFDDKDIIAATSGLIRYGKITEQNLRPAMEVMTDLAARVGSVDTAGELLAKALADPTKAAGKLSRYGIILTKQQQKQIKAMAEAGDVAGAQALILDELAKSTEGAAAASQGPYRRALSVLADVSEDARKALAQGFLPVIEKVADLLSKELAKPQTMRNLKAFGETLAGGLDDLIDIARGLPWGTIGDSLKLAGQGAKIVLDAFSSLPPWVQTAVATAWGLNKLTGGALSGIAGELGKGLIKGVLGMNAGVVNIKAGVVTGVGGVPGGGSPIPPVAAAPAAGLGLGGLATAVAVPTILVGGGLLSLKSIADAADRNNELARAGLTQEEIIAQKYYTGTKAYQQTAFKQLHGRIPPREVFDSGTAKLVAAQGRSTTATQRASDRQYTAAERIRTGVVTSEAQTRTVLGTNLRQVQAAIAIARATAAASAVSQRVATVSGAIRQATATAASASRIVSAIERNRPIISSTTIHNTQVVRDRQTKSNDRHV